VGLRLGLGIVPTLSTLARSIASRIVCTCGWTHSSGVVEKSP